eukprot:1503296-Rhodomonas_salina.3
MVMQRDNAARDPDVSYLSSGRGMRTQGLCVSKWAQSRSQNQLQENARLVQIELRLCFLVFDFGGSSERGPVRRRGRRSRQNSRSRAPGRGRREVRTERMHKEQQRLSQKRMGANGVHSECVAAWAFVSACRSGGGRWLGG